MQLERSSHVDPSRLHFSSRDGIPSMFLRAEMSGQEAKCILLSVLSSSSCKHTIHRQHGSSSRHLFLGLHSCRTLGLAMLYRPLQLSLEAGVCHGSLTSCTEGEAAAGDCRTSCGEARRASSILPSERKSEGGSWLDCFVKCGQEAALSEAALALQGEAQAPGLGPKGAGAACGRCGAEPAAAWECKAPRRRAAPFSSGGAFERAGDT